MAKYQDFQSALKDEKALLDLIARLPEKEYYSLLNAASEYSKVGVAAYELQKKQEETKAIEIQERIKKVHEEEETKRKNLHLQAQKQKQETDLENQKKLETFQTEAEKEKLQYKLQKETEQQKERTRLKLEAKHEFDKLHTDRLEREKAATLYKAEIRRKELDEALSRKKDLLDTKLKKKAELEKQKEIDLADFRLSQKLKEFEATKEHLMEREKEVQKISSQASVESTRIKYEQLTNFFTGPQGKERLWSVGGVVIAGIVTWQVTKSVSPLLFKGLNQYFFAPQLVHKLNKKTIFTPFKNIINPPKKHHKTVFNPKFEEKMNGIIQGVANTSKRGGYFGQLLLHGPPGTGKNLFAERLAKESSMSFAMISGPSFDQFEPKDAIKEIKNLFSWANKSKQGVLLFVDEADSFLEDRTTLDAGRVRVLNEWITQTGTESNKFMCIYETNRPQVLDNAIQSRVARTFEFPTPSNDEIKQMLLNFIDSHIVNNKRDQGFFTRLFSFNKKVLNIENLVEENKINEIVEKLGKLNFVGRDVSNLVIALTQAGYANPNFELTNEVIDEVVSEQEYKKSKEVAWWTNRVDNIELHRSHSTK